MNIIQRVVKRKNNLTNVLIPSMTTGFMAAASRCYAGMPWEGPLETIQESVTGPVATGVCTIIVVITGIAIAFYRVFVVLRWRWVLLPS